MSDVIALARSMLETSVDRWAALARVDGALLDRRPSPGEWSAIQALQHVVDTEEAVFHARIHAILEGRDFAGFDPEVEGFVDRIALPAPALAERLGGLRAATLRTIGALEVGDLAKTAVHAELGRVTLAELLNELAAHDTMHVVQAERALMQAFIPGSGPWRPYFVDHDVAAVRG